MSLFRVKGQPIKFDLVGLNADDLSKIKTIILENGGRVEHNNKQPIKFTRQEKFITHAFPAFKLYDIKFIIDCKKNGRILDPSPYRIGRPVLYDDCLMNNYLHGCCVGGKVSPMAIIKTENASNSDSDNHPRHKKQMSEDNSDQSSSRVNGSINRNVSRSDENAGPSSRDNESETSMFSVTEDDTSEVPRAHTTNNKSRKGPGFRYSENGRGQKISQAERNAIVKYLVDNRLIGEALRGLPVWITLISSGICENRTANSLYRHFRRYILPNIETYNLTERQLQRFKRLSDHTK